ncbi:ABC transporter permease [Aureibacillus halotolerans]|uniref:ABC transporter permease n=1 Tax=Aureibacillus halotolerans TaxID=1508390 RepID=UPI00105E4FDD|nr:ABC transporter permease [Aureibacillus halotolerans]
MPPMFFAGAFYLLTQQSMQSNTFQVDVAIVDEDQSFETGIAIDQLVQSEELNKLIHVVETDRMNALNMLEDQSVSAVILLPEGFGADVTYGVNTPAEVIGHPAMPLEAAVVRYVMEAAAKYTTATQSAINTIDATLRANDAPQATIKQEFQINLLTFGAAVINRSDWFEEKTITSLLLSDRNTYYILSGVTLLWLIWSLGSTLLIGDLHTIAVQKRLRALNASLWFEAFARAASLLCIMLVLMTVTVALLQLIEVQISWSTAALCVVALSLWFLLWRSVFSPLLYLLFSISWIVAAALLGGLIVPQSFLPDALAAFSPFMVTSHIFTELQNGLSDQQTLAPTLMYWCAGLLAAYLVTFTKLAKRREARQ